jgi:hypothetical protein
LLSVLLTICAHQHRARTARMQKADLEQRNGIRWYSDAPVK